MSTPNTPIRWQALVAKYQSPDTWRSVWQIVNSVVPFFVFWYVMYRSLEISYWLTLLLSIPTAGFMVRMFIIFHDCCHGSFFKSSLANDRLGTILGVLVLTPYFEWKHAHAIHHATAGDLDRRGVGDVLTLTVSEYQKLPWYKKIGYRIMRNPLILFTLGSAIVFLITHRFSRYEFGKREHNSVIFNDLAIAAVVAWLAIKIGWQAVLMVELPVVFIAASAGVWLFYVQHNFDGTYWERHDKWEFFKAGMTGSSYYKLPAILNWFTGNIGFHHIHHLSPRIPNYKLPWAYKENPAFQIKPLTIPASLKSLSYRLWDEEQKMLVGFRALKNYRKRQMDAA